MNALQYETSPYLLQHKHNPVNWYAWGTVPFELALQQNKPLLISIGYSSCHWCHVMEQESFMDKEVAALMNELFINVKVDREERPDIDALYMQALTVITGSGGWPLHVFVTPQKEPFYAGTYFPPIRMYNRASWKEILINVHQYYTKNPQEVALQTSKLKAHLFKLNAIGNQLEENEQKIDIDPKKIIEKVLENADKEFGGFGNAPKFPNTFCLQLLMQYHVQTKDSPSLNQVTLTLSKMYCGGIYDHIGGGFARYSTDRRWFAPHFEKMLYDNALLIETYAIAYSITKQNEYKIGIQEIMQWLLREMTHNEGAFFSAQDADTEHEEGKYYTWQYSEIKAILGSEADSFCDYYSIIPEGNWEHGKNILHISNYENENTTKYHVSRNKLLAIRNLRTAPLTDIKINLAWNALMCKALVVAYTHTHQQYYLLYAERAMNFISKYFKDDKTFYFHIYTTYAKIPAFADDLVYLTQALIYLASATANTSYLIEANSICTYILTHYTDKNNCLLKLAHSSQSEFEIPNREIYDNVLPSYNAVFTQCLEYLSLCFNHTEWENQRKIMLQYMKPFINNHPSSFAVWVSEIIKNPLLKTYIIIVGKNAKKDYLVLNKKYNPYVTYYTSITNVEINIFRNKYNENKTSYYVCNQFQCMLATNEITEIKKYIQTNL